MQNVVGFSLLGAALFTAAVIAAQPAAPLSAQSEAAPSTIPNFMPDVQTSWFPDRPAGDDFLPPESGPGPVLADAAHPYVTNQAGQPTYRVADLSNPILKPWAIEQMKRANEAVLAGKIPFTARERCWPGGVPDFDIYERDRPIYFLQTPKEVLILAEHDQQVRRIYLDVPHSPRPALSWYGESVGHYEGEVLVVDTIAMNDKTSVDNYRTPHTTELHVVERFRLIDGGKMLEAVITVSDPGAFNMPWSAIQRWRRLDDRPLLELVCAEDGGGYLQRGLVPIPQADKLDF